MINVKEINPRCACFNLRKASRAVTQCFDHVLEPVGIRATQFTLLVSMASLGARTLTEMANSLVMDRTTLTRNLKPLEKMALIQAASSRDKRSKAYMLTDHGRSVLDRCMPVWEKLQSHIEERLTSGRYKHLVQELNDFTRVINEQIMR
ncbi:MAG: MarR family winged helix-turn-helix transcriptional regulator [Pseudomonadota bacterium]